KRLLSLGCNSPSVSPLLFTASHMAATKHPARCRVCDVPTSEIHMGFNCCRACSVFYKRTVSRDPPLRCKGGKSDCISKDPETKCRKCRFERFCSVIDECSDVKPKESNEDAENINKTTFLDHETSFAQSDVSTSETPTLEKMKMAYRLLCLIRKNGETASCSTDEFDELQRGTIKFVNATYNKLLPHCRIMSAGLVDFFAFAFEDFRNLPRIRQHSLVSSSFDILARTDSLYRSVHHFPEDDTLMPSYTTIFSLDRVEEFMIDCPPGGNKEEAGKELAKNNRRTMIPAKGNFKRLQPSPEEFVALLGLTLWREHASNSDYDITEIIKTNRDAILGELHIYYAIKGRTDYASRLGDMLCLLMNMEESEALHREDMQVYQLMDMFNEFSPYV
ncbi:hypothetical protein PMAYCL1PPCAC_20257, partial [Pristionchus mayeri]